MKNKLFYIFGLATVVLSSCHDDEVFDTLSGTAEKTPLPVTVALSTGNNSVQTRAVDKSFEENDELLVYIQHVKDVESHVSSVDIADKAPALVSFKVNNGTMSELSTVDPTTLKTSNLTLTSIFHNGSSDNLVDQTHQTTLYWDDFSDSNRDDTYLRTPGHGLRTYYGYCYNGGTPTTTLNHAEGTLGWTVATNQDVLTDSIKTCDLLWSSTQQYVVYEHKEHKDDERLGLTIPYTHAMSKVTIVLVAGDGFSDSSLASAKVTLKNMYTKCTVTAPTEQITEYEQTGSVQNVPMYRHKQNETAKVNGKTARAFEAIVVPHKVLSLDTPIALIENMEGNEYNITATASIISQFLHNNTTSYNVGDVVTLESGKNYKLTITVDKQPQTIEAKITNWEDVSATGTGEIVFANDITTKGDIVEALKTGGFDVYKSSVNTSFGEKNTTLQWVDSKWKYDPIVYWAGQGDSAYFRALAPAETSTTISQGNDILWGYACDKEEDIKKVGTATEVKITPRTGNVPLIFEHAMSKVTFNLEDINKNATVPGWTEDEYYTIYNHPLNPRLFLYKAKIQISNLYKEGTISIHNGVVTVTGSKASKMFGDGTGFLPAKWNDKVNEADEDTDSDGIRDNLLKDYFMVPQGIPSDAKITITLQDGTTYSAQLNLCKLQTGTDSDGKPVYGDPISKWESGKHYVYIILLSKETITFRALIKDWEEKQGSGNATLDWD